MRKTLLIALLSAGAGALAGCGHAPATHVAETATARPAPLYAPANGAPVRATHDGKFKVDVTGMSSVAEAKATTWAAAQHHCHGLQAQAVEVGFSSGVQSNVGIAHSIPILGASVPYLKHTGELTFKCVGRAEGGGRAS